MSKTKDFFYTSAICILILAETLLFSSCQKTVNPVYDCNEHHTASLTVKNGLYHGIWVDAREIINTNFDKRYLLPGESHVFIVNSGNINLVASFISDDSSFKTLHNYNMLTCYEIENDIKSVCQQFNTIKSITFINATSKPIVTDILYWGIYWAGEVTIQPNESFSYYMIKHGDAFFYYRYIDTEYWNTLGRKFLMSCDSVSYRCVPYEIKDIQPMVKQEFTPLENSIFPE
jgi:hypothetical protein